MKAFVLTTRRQLGIAAIIAGAALWMGVSTASMMVSLLSVGAVDQAVLRERAKFERLIADRQARLNDAVGRLSDTNGSFQAQAQMAAKRHEALGLMLAPLRGLPGASSVFAQGATPIPANLTPTSQIRLVLSDQDRLIESAETFARTRGDRLKLALRLAGMDPASYNRTVDSSLGGPLIEAKDPRALAAVMDVSEDFARRIQRAATDGQTLRAMYATADRLPLGVPTQAYRRASGYGVRFDPFTRSPAFHSGLDFAAPLRTPIYATAPGVISFTGVRSGYGNTIEIDHGGGYKTRFAHLSSIGVRVGDRVTVGQRIGGMGSTGRSTGSHLHYEVWVNGRAQNPDRFLRAGEYALRAGE